MNNDLKKRMIMEDVHASKHRCELNRVTKEDKEKGKLDHISNYQYLSGKNSIKEDFAFEKAKEVVPLIEEYICSGFAKNKDVVISYPRNHWEFLDRKIRARNQDIGYIKYTIMQLKIQHKIIMEYLMWLMLATPILTLAAYLFKRTSPFYVIIYGLMYAAIYEWKIYECHSYILENPKEVFERTVDKSWYSLSQKWFDNMLMISLGGLFIITAFLVFLIVFAWICGAFSWRHY